MGSHARVHPQRMNYCFVSQNPSWCHCVHAQNSRSMIFHVCPCLNPGATIAPCMNASQTLTLQLFYCCPHHRSPGLLLLCMCQHPPLQVCDHSTYIYMLNPGPMATLKQTQCHNHHISVIPQSLVSLLLCTFLSSRL